MHSCVTQHKQQINSLPEQLIIQNTYEELGQLISKKVGGINVSPSATGLQKVHYTYNMRGWLKSINDITTEDDLFAFKLVIMIQQKLYSMGIFQRLFGKQTVIIL
ncbi:hypothetical protein LXD69_02740 [Flavobacterium sediminilitoris]|uniref:Uncharacterized protein n=1 Tax=Flavobacterium sediminilitoris TaxID=2024526 RepID=A0ABY4HNJ1_9FLAO|nr:MULTISPECIES: hypothetical protein [Flavobacterium]UOX34437.1 hypothetical protein LXD69_02740 [Flavobacterium sediminilitoris]